MMIDQMKLSYPEFVRFVFDRSGFIRYIVDRQADDESGLAELWKDGYIEPFFDESMVVEFISKIYKEIIDIQSIYSEHVVVSGLRYFIDWTRGRLCYSIFSDNVDASKRIDAISSMLNVFTYLFNVKCIYDVDERNRNIINYGDICYRWWAILPRHRVPEPRSLDNRRIDDTILDTMDRILYLENKTCKMSALYGLGLWQSARPDAINKIIERHEEKIPRCLNVYVRRAIHGEYDL